MGKAWGIKREKGEGGLKKLISLALTHTPESAMKGRGKVRMVK